MKTFKQLINEGGNAITVSSRIRQEDVADTMKDIEKKLLPKLGITKKETTLLGSAGKKREGETSGDIDLAIDAHRLIYLLNINDPADLYKVVEAKVRPLVKQTAILAGFGTVSVAWPIANQKNKYVQLDLMLVNDMDLARFTFWSPSAMTSKYKGLYRNIMLSSIASSMDFKTIKTGFNKEGEEIPVEFERNFMDVKRGLIRGIQTRIGKTGKLLSKKKTIATKVVADQPQKIIDLVLGTKFTPDDANSFESLVRILDHKDFLYKNKKKEILKTAADKIRGIQGLTLPKELKNY
jgi:hypothetical protein